MICTAIKGPTSEQVDEQIFHALKHADLIELRLDSFKKRDIATLQALRNKYPVPMVFTLRSQSQGGLYRGTEEERLLEIGHLASLKPEYFDIESHVPSNYIQEVRKNHPEIKIILSYHDFTSFPDNLDDLYEKLSKTPADIYKIALMPKSTCEAIKLLCWVKNLKKKNVIAIGMGPFGQITRILGPIAGSLISYASLNHALESAPGQLLAEILNERYGYHRLNPETCIYGLIGNPVEMSISDLTHNMLMQRLGLDAVYVKMDVKHEELADFIALAKKLPFCGLSITMPFKEAILPFIDEIDPSAAPIGAINTLVFRSGKIIGYNTDGIGALNAIESHIPIKNKHIAILGAGGAAGAIAYTACQRGARVTILNRTPERAERMAQKVHCRGLTIDQMPQVRKEGYDVLINCTPIDMPIDTADILPSATIMDIRAKPKETPFLQHAAKKHCHIIFGYEMFVDQALKQFELWFNNFTFPSESRKILHDYALAILNENVK